MPFTQAPAQLAGEDAVGVSLRHRTSSVIPARLVIPSKAGIQRLVLDSGSSLHSARNDGWGLGGGDSVVEILTLSEGAVVRTD